MNQYEARNFSESLNLPYLKEGIWEEIQWAERIRAEKLEQVPFFEREWEMFCSERDARYLTDNCLQQLRQQDKAKFWIENRDLDFWELLELFD